MPYHISWGNNRERVFQEEEDFEKWDDLIEWKGYVKALGDLERKLKEIDKVQDIRITE